MSHKFGEDLQSLKSKNILNNYLKITKDDVNFDNKRLLNVAEPIENTDAINKGYLDKEISVVNQKLFSRLGGVEAVIIDNDKWIQQNKQSITDTNTNFAKFIVETSEVEVPISLEQQWFKNEKDLRIIVAGNKCTILGTIIFIGNRFNIENRTICHIDSYELFKLGYHTVCCIDGKTIAPLFLDKDCLEIYYKFKFRNEKVYINTTFTLNIMK